MDFPENLEISGRTAELVKAYLEQWRDLARGSSGMELVRFFEHIRRRVLLDNDTPEVRRWLCMVAIKACNDLADFGRTLTGAERAAAVQCGALAEMFRQIAEDEDEITVEMDVPRSAGLPVGSSCILRFNKAARTSIEPAPTTVLPEEVTFRFQLGALAKGRPSEGGYHKIAVAEGVDLIDLLTSSPSPAEYGERWTEMFDRMAWQVLFSHHIPGELRRAYSGLVVILLNSLRKFTDDAGWVFDVPVPPDTNRLLSRIFGHIADGGPADYTVYSRQGVLILKASISHKDRAAVRHLNVDDDMSIVPALRRLSESDVVSAANHAATPRSRTKARPNEPCPCGSQRKYKKCCGAH